MKASNFLLFVTAAGVAGYDIQGILRPLLMTDDGGHPAERTQAGVVTGRISHPSGVKTPEEVKAHVHKAKGDVIDYIEKIFHEPRVVEARNAIIDAFNLVEDDEDHYDTIVPGSPVNHGFDKPGDAPDEAGHEVTKRADLQSHTPPV
jgi:hypothetical protein